MIKTPYKIHLADDYYLDKKLFYRSEHINSKLLPIFNIKECLLYPK